MAAKETLLTGKKNPKKEDKTRVQTTTTQRKNKHIDY